MDDLVLELQNINQMVNQLEDADPVEVSPARVLRMKDKLLSALAQWAAKMAEADPEGHSKWPVAEGRLLRRLDALEESARRMKIRMNG